MWAALCFSQLWALAMQEAAIHWQVALGLAWPGSLASPWLILLLCPVTFLEHYSFPGFGSALFPMSIPLLATLFCFSLPLISLLSLLSLKKTRIITLKSLSLSPPTFVLLRLSASLRRWSDTAGINHIQTAIAL